jgi:hypothetical protein
MGLGSPVVLTAGVDLSSQASHTAACVINWSDGRAVVTDLSLGVTDETIGTLLTEVDKLGIDVPLGWPISFARAVARHSEDGSWPADYTHADTTMYRFRRTDIWVWRTLETSPPLSVSTDRIALPAMRAAALLSRLPERPPLDGSGVVVEAYPAASLRRWGFPWRGYKRNENSDARWRLVDQVRGRTSSWLTIGDGHIARCRSSDDALDALIAALVARAAAVGLVEPVPTDLRPAALREGWISIPRPDSLDQLPVRTARRPHRIRVDTQSKVRRKGAFMSRPKGIDTSPDPDSPDSGSMSGAGSPDDPYLDGQEEDSFPASDPHSDWAGPPV